MSGPTPTPDCRFRHEGEFGERVALASYPRSGNTMARKLLEEVTGIFTGSDTRGGRAMADMLKGYGLMGEANCTRSSWVIKTHFPERLGWMKFPVRRAILLVRHPVNAIDSYFNMQLAACHTMSLDESQYERFAEVWADHVATEAQVWADFHKFWFAQEIPTLVVRYEDLLESRERELRRMFVFLYQPVDDFGTEVSMTDWVDPGEFAAAKARLDRVLAQREAAGVVYKPRKASLRPDYAHYSEEQKGMIYETCKEYLHAFGYAMDGGDGGGGGGACAERTAAPRVADLNGRDESSAPTASAPGLPTLRLNNGPVVRALTEADPQGRGFPWKWKIRQIVQLEGKAEAGCVDQRDFIRKLKSESQASGGGAPSAEVAASQGAVAVNVVDEGAVPDT